LTVYQTASRGKWAHAARMAVRFSNVVDVSMCVNPGVRSNNTRFGTTLPATIFGDGGPHDMSLSSAKSHVPLAPT
jgi:hypothetical protein